MPKSRRITVIASMRNEGPFIVEWVAWYRALGFTDVLVVTNDCTDRSPELLDALAVAKRIHHSQVNPPAHASITIKKLAAVRNHRSVRWADWVFVCDVDEFLVIHKGKGKIDDLIGAPDCPPPFTAMSINWKVFGTGGIEVFHDIPIHQQFFLSVKQASPISDHFKTIFRKIAAYPRLFDHAPDGWDPDLGGEWGTGDNLWVNSEGKVLAGYSPLNPPMRKTSKADTTFEVAQVNHYMLRSSETFSLKSGTTSPTARRDRYTPTYFNTADKGKEIDQSVLKLTEAFEAERARLMALPNVARLHLLCCADHLRLIAEKHGRDPGADPRIADFLARAAEMENGAPE